MSEAQRAYLYLRCACGARMVMKPEPERAARDVAAAGWELPTLSEEAAGKLDRCPTCVAWIVRAS